MAKTLKGRDIDIALCRIGFIREIDGDHIWYRFPNSNVRTKISHGMRGHDIGQELIALIAKQLHVTKKQFLEVIDQTMDREQYTKILKELELLRLT